MFGKSKWQRVVDAKRAAQLAAIPSEYLLSANEVEEAKKRPSSAMAVIRANLSARELEITEKDAPKLVALLASGELTSEETVSAFCHRAALAHCLTNCLTEIMFKEAIERAKQIDNIFKLSKKPIGKLHGLPVSVKDHYNVKGSDSTIGFVSWAENPAEEHGAVPERLVGAGAIIICKTNVPQSMLAWESNNPVFGWTANPWNYGLTPGGSSGGEGTLVALKGSPLGCGSDIGGSIRVPSAFSGLFGIKPSSGRVPSVGAPAPDAGQHAIPGVFGPMGHSVEALKLWLKVVIGENGEHIANWDDPSVVPMPMGSYTPPQRLKLGVMMDNDTNVKLTPAVRRGMVETIEKLRKAGHTVKEVITPSVMEVHAMFYALISASNFVDILAQIAKIGEPMEESLASTYQLIRIGNLGRRIARTLLRTFSSDTFTPVLLENIKGDIKVSEYFKKVEASEELRRRWLMWFNAEFGGDMDAVLCPVAAVPPPAKGTVKDITPAIVYTSMWNVLDWTAGVVPVTRVDPVKDIPDPKLSLAPTNATNDAVQKMYATEFATGSKFANAPIAVQVVGRRLEEEKILAIMQIVGDVVGPLPDVVDVAGRQGPRL